MGYREFAASALKKKAFSLSVSLSFILLVEYHFNGNRILFFSFHLTILIISYNSS
jgi:hypothetical protein